MSAIVTLTFNPAIDKSTSTDQLVPEKKLRCNAPIFEPGGGGINVARAVHKLGGEASAVYLAGGYTGKALTRLLNSEKIASIPSEISGDTRENLVVFEQSTSRQFRFVMPGPKVTTPECRACLQTIERMNEISYIVVSGSMPDGIPQGIFADISHIARSKNARLIVDTSGEALKNAVHRDVFMIKPNLKELSTLAGTKEIAPDRAADAAQRVIRSGAFEVIVLSMGGQGAILVTKDSFLRLVPPKVEVKSTVGAGDSLLAGMVYSLSQGKSLEDAARYGVACGTSATLNPGTELCRKVDADRLYRLIAVASS